MNNESEVEVAEVGEEVKGFIGGQKLMGRYTLIRVLGHGGMGVVWLARDEELERDVAMKFLPAILVNDRAGLSELKRETKRSLELTHPNIVRTYDFVQDSTIAGITMEYVECDTLRNRRLDQASGVFDPADLGPWVRQLCSALDYAHHEAAIVHRDLKPANLMINARDQLKVADFGISRSLVDSVSQVSMRRAVSGTLVYMSPQQLEGESPTASDDIYAVGATIYELITSRAPFFSGDIAGQVRTKVPASMQSRRTSFGIAAGEIPANWEETIASCLAKDPTQRPRSAGEIAVQLGLCAAADITAPALEVPRATATFSDASVQSPGTAQPLTTMAGAPLARRTVRWIPLAAAAVALIGLGAWLLGSLLPQQRATRAAAAREKAEADRLANARGTVVVKTEPAGASVKVGDALPQTAPAVFPELKLGKHPVQISREGYEPQTIAADVRENQTTDLGTVTLTRSRGLLKITTQPEGLAYELRSEANPFQPIIGVTPMEEKELETGTYDIKVVRKGWPQQMRTFTVARGELREAFFDLSGGEVTITSTPPGAAVMKDKEQLGVTPLPLKDVPPGGVKYTLALNGYENATVEANVEAGQAVTVEQALKKASPRVAQTSSRRRSGTTTKQGADSERSERIKRAFIPYYGIFKPGN